ncbi:MAG: class I SAM-dependent methyltransferase [Rhodothermaceae bacterium]
MEKFFLPGGRYQLKFFLNQEIDIKGKSVLVVGSGSEQVAKKLAEESESAVHLIVEDYDSLMNSKIALDHNPAVDVRLMDFEITDFNQNEFDFIYAQASVSGSRRNKIIKELKRILKPEGIFCAGEIVNLKEDMPVFLQDIWESADLDPMNIGKVDAYYEERNFEVEETKNLSDILKEYYRINEKMLPETKEGLSEQEKSYYKKLIKRVSHESGVYLKQGGDSYIGFYVLVMRKK